MTRRVQSGSLAAERLVAYGLPTNGEAPAAAMDQLGGVAGAASAFANPA